MWKMAPPEKRIKRTGIDFLSQLSDDVLLRVLSHLPANEAVRCSSLSRRWRRLPPLLPVRPHLRLGPPAVRDLEGIERGLSSETSLLTTCKILPCEKPGAEDIASWTESLICRRVLELLIDFRRCRPAVRPDASSIVRCKSLIKLKLYRCSLLQQIQVDCVSLTHLLFIAVKMSDAMLLEFTSRCKSLTNLELERCYGFKCFRLQDARRLKRLCFYSRENSARDVVDRIEIEAPNLEELELTIRSPKRGFDLVAPRLRMMYICLPSFPTRHFYWTAPWLWKGIFQAPGVSCLELRGGAMNCLAETTIPGLLKFPFLNLKCLYINIVMASGPQARCLISLLRHLTMLEQLNLVIVQDDMLSTWRPAWMPLSKEDKIMLEHSICISFRLQQVTVSGFTGDPFEMALLSFILRRALVLKKMSINLSRMSNNESEMKAKSLTHCFQGSPKVEVLVKKDLVD